MPEKILIIRFSSIGDIVLTTPVIRCLKTQLPGVAIHFATKKQYAGLLQANPYIDKLHLFEEKKLPTLLQALADEKFDLIIDLHHNLRSFLIKSNLGIEARSFHKLNFAKWLMVQCKINRLPDKHIVDRYLETVRDFGVVNDNKGLDHFIPESEEINISTLPPGFQNGYAVYAIGAMHATKKLPVSKAIALCEHIALPVILLGGPEDAESGNAIAASAPEKIMNGCGKYSIHNSASIIRQSKKVFTHDTGMMHIAAALQKEIVSVWGNTIPEFGMYPFYGKQPSLSDQRKAHSVLEVTGLSCRPCSKIGYAACPKGHFRCMQEISFENVS